MDVGEGWKTNIIIFVYSKIDVGESQKINITTCRQSENKYCWLENKYIYNL